MTEPTATRPPLGTSVDWIVPFHDLDPLEICWHGHYVRYFEYARTALLQQLDYDYPQMRESGYSWPVIELQIRYAQPLRYQQRIRISATIVEWENRLKIRYEIRDADSGQRLTHGHTVQVAVDMASNSMCFVSPPILLQKLGVPRP
ncbi:acyl-CoA thioester hydrolase [Andreprevotia lacus DSM 23236]|jgi:acyl-CoA thioester hydrolase|uniref:Acyl-CoA thioester hydrolase n=1 Tax=Andreprevotia lacus DSM 23236 TaxID=1121001 RepID=A0A1W1X3T4_9NEIS|nr:acyl-CoA thioesterase [Andreprevotia lacus]SMC18586.1 acyl-CoA thioester hydrolase [Andreprevotia lacus DSM 23236]